MSPTTEPLSVYARPELAPSVTVDDPLGGAELWIIARDGVPTARVSAAVATVAREFTGVRSITEIAAALGEPWTPADVGGVAERFGGAGLLVGAGRRRAARRSGPVRYLPPLTVQWSFGDPSVLFGPLRPLVRVLTGAPGAVLGVLVVVAGLVATALGWADIGAVLERPIPLAVIAWLGVAIVLTTVVHELGHGAALSAFGGAPRRIGVMLFYLAPAFFCDVTDGWRLSRRSQRVIVALAGPAVHLVCAAVAIVVSRFVDPSLQAAFVLYALSCLVIAALNLLPFVQLDGYLALMAALDRPHLRRDAMAAASTAATRVLSMGARGRSRSGQVAAPVHGSSPRRLLVAYGILCRVFPVLLVGVVLYRYATSIAGLGPVPAGAYLATLVLVAVVVVRAAVRGMKAIPFASLRPWRVATGVVGALAAAAVLTLIPVAPMHSVGFAVSGGEARVIAPAGGELPAPGTEVVLESSGILVSRPLGTAVVGGGEPQRGSVDLAALVPVSPSGLTAESLSIKLTGVDSAELPEFGRARFSDPRSATVGAWLWQTFLARPLSALVSEAGS